MPTDYGFSDPNQNPTANVQPTTRYVELLRLQADWQTDGYGLRGPQQDRPRVNAKPFDMTFGVTDRHHTSGDGTGGAALDVADETFADFPVGETLVSHIDKITFDSQYFKVHDNGGGEVQVTLITCEAACGAS